MYLSVISVEKKPQTLASFTCLFQGREHVSVPGKGKKKRESEVRKLIAAIN